MENKGFITKHTNTHFGVPPKELPLFLDTKQAAKTGYASTRTIRRMCASGEIFAVKVGNYWRIPRDRFLKDIARKM